MGDLNLTVVILTHNEEEKLPKCLKSVFWVNKIIVIDDESSDQTLEIARRANAEIYKRKLDNFASQRNFALEKVKTDWVLMIDPDEEISKELSEEMKKAIEENRHDAYRFPRKNIIFGKWIQHCGWYPDYQTHLFKTSKGKYVGKIHEQVEISGTTGQLENPLVHDNYKSLSQYLEKNLKYSSLEAERQLDSGYQFTWQDLLRKPTDEFLRRFFAEDGFRDGTHGLALSLLQTFVTLFVYLKIWEKEGFEQEDAREILKEVEKSAKDTDYWIARKTNNPLKKILHKLR